MRDNYRWGIREFLHAYVTEVEEEQLNDSVQIRIRKLTEAIFDHQEVLNMVKDRWKSSPDAGFILLDDLRQEIDTLRTNSVQFGQFKGEKSLEAFDMNQAVDELKNAAPLLHRTLDYLIAAH